MRKLVHICLTSPFLDGYGYDENIMPFFHKMYGYDVSIISCNEDNSTSDSLNDEGFRIVRLAKGNRLKKISQFGYYPELYGQLLSIQPDIIYVHNPQFISFFQITKYIKNRIDVRLYVDNHDDYYNSPIKGIKSIILYKFIYRSIIMKSSKYVRCFWGTTPWRCDYLHKVFGIPNTKIKLLVMGGDDRLIDYRNRNRIRNAVRSKYNISKDEFLIVTGGKIVLEKNIHLLAEAVEKLKYDNVKLIIFGNIDSNMESIFAPFFKSKRIIFAGWMNQKDYYQIFMASDIGMFPGTHSILWEQACACGLPIVVKEWPGMKHVDVGGNALFLHECTTDCISRMIEKIYTDKSVYSKMLYSSENIAAPYFSYSRISKEAIEEPLDEAIVGLK